MTTGYERERIAIETFIAGNWPRQHWTLGLGDEPFTPRDYSAQITIVPARAVQGTIGRVSNRIDHPGNVVISMFTPAAMGSSEWRAVADLVIGLVREKTIDAEGKPITAASVPFVRFSPPFGEILHPYVSASFRQASFLRCNITAPFVRYDFT